MIARWSWTFKNVTKNNRLEKSIINLTLLCKRMVFKPKPLRVCSKLKAISKQAQKKRDSSHALLDEEGFLIQKINLVNSERYKSGEYIDMDTERHKNGEYIDYGATSTMCYSNEPNWIRTSGEIFPYWTTFHHLILTSRDVSTSHPKKIPIWPIHEEITFRFLFVKVCLKFWWMFYGKCQSVPNFSKNGNP